MPHPNWIEYLKSVDTPTLIWLRSETRGTTGKVFPACGVAPPPLLRPC